MNRQYMTQKILMSFPLIELDEMRRIGRFILQYEMRGSNCSTFTNLWEARTSIVVQISKTYGSVMLFYGDIVSVSGKIASVVASGSSLAPSMILSIAKDVSSAAFHLYSIVIGVSNISENYKKAYMLSRKRGGTPLNPKDQYYYTVMWTLICMIIAEYTVINGRQPEDIREFIQRNLFDLLQINT